MLSRAGLKGALIITIAHTCFGFLFTFLFVVSALSFLFIFLFLSFIFPLPFLFPSVARGGGSCILVRQPRASSSSKGSGVVSGGFVTIASYLIAMLLRVLSFVG